MNQLLSKLKSVYGKYQLLQDGTRICHLDEAGVPNDGTLSRVLAAKGQHAVCQAEIAEHRTLVTCGAIVIATGVTLN